MLMPLLIETSANLLRRERLQEAERRRRARDLPAHRATRARFVLDRRALVHRFATPAALVHIATGEHP